MSGRCEVQHEIKVWQAKGKLTGMERAALHLCFFVVPQLLPRCPRTLAQPVPLPMENVDYSSPAAVQASEGGDESINAERHTRAPEGSGGDEVVDASSRLSTLTLHSIGGEAEQAGTSSQAGTTSRGKFDLTDCDAPLGGSQLADSGGRMPAYKHGITASLLYRPLPVGAK